MYICVINARLCGFDAAHWDNYRGVVVVEELWHWTWLCLFAGVDVVVVVVSVVVVAVWLFDFPQCGTAGADIKPPPHPPHTHSPPPTPGGSPVLSKIPSLVGQNIALRAVPAYKAFLPTECLPSRLIPLHFPQMSSVLNGGMCIE